MSTDKSCYSTLSTYNTHRTGTVYAPVSKPEVMRHSVTTVPAWAKLSADEANKETSGNGYFSITNAYRTDKAKMINRACGENALH